MKRAISMAAATLVALAGQPERTTAQTQQARRFTYSVTRTHSHTMREAEPVMIDWLQGSKEAQRYTVSVSPLRLVSSGLKVDLEKELDRPGRWLGTSLAVYFAPNSHSPGWYDWSSAGNNRASFYSGWEDYHRMWGVGTSLFYKHIFERRGWYWTAGAVLEYFRVGVTHGAYLPYVEDGLAFYEYGSALENKSYLKPAAQFNMGKHFAVSQRCYLDAYVGVGLAWSLYADDERHRYEHGYPYPLFADMNGFAYRGIYPVAGFRFGMLLWQR